jgi:eukaryotic-like serine/threonine-protein kinase
LPTAEARVRAVILVSGGLEFQKTFQEVDAVNFAPRVKRPTLMLNGRYDAFFPIRCSACSERSQPTRSTLCSKRDTSNGLVIQESLDWLDHYLGPVK